MLVLMTALPTLPSFMGYETVYLPKNHCTKAEFMETEDYLPPFRGCLYCSGKGTNNPHRTIEIHSNGKICRAKGDDYNGTE